jgi:two-component system cell cycle response regulator
MNAHDGLRSAQGNPPDLVLLDLDLPDVSGFDVCRELKADPRTMNIPVLFLTGTEDPSVKAAALDLGAIDYITKPFDPAELRARVRSALRTKRYHDLLAARAQLDGLTGLWNRGYFDRRLEGELSAALRHHHPLAIALIDLDHFKRLNDTYGHPFGDQILQTFASTLTRTVRASDVACRYGGEEFVVILRDTARGEAVRAAERIRCMVRELNMTSRGQQVAVTASVGVASLDKKAAAGHGGLKVRAAELIQAADSALYQAKGNGRDQVVIVNLE